MNSDKALIEQRISESIEVKRRILDDKALLQHISEAADVICDCLRDGGRVYLCGNGGSASDALHIAGELVGKFQKDRASLPAVALNENAATMTSIANDYGYDRIYERQIAGFLAKGDVLIGISTSGNSENIYNAVQAANGLGGHTIALLGKDGGKIKNITEYALVIPSDCTARIQESHIMIGHIICEIVEDRFA